MDNTLKYIWTTQSEHKYVYLQYAPLNNETLVNLVKKLQQA
jgi:hypothetical protein